MSDLLTRIEEVEAIDSKHPAREEAEKELFPDLLTAYRALLAASTAQQERIKRLEGELAAAVSKLAEIRETCAGEEHFIVCEILSIIENE